MISMSPESRETYLYVVIHLHTPREKYWGLLQGTSGAGVWLTGIDLRTVEEQLNYTSADDEGFLVLSTTFFPMQRIEKITVDECLGEIPSIKNSLQRRLDVAIEDLLPDSFNLPPEFH